MEAAWIGGGEAWKAKAVALRLRLRDRFRVAVDRHWPRAGVSDAYGSPTVQRWVSRFRRFRDDSSGRSAVFYQKRVKKIVDVVEDGAIVRTLQAIAVPVIGNVCHVFMRGLNQVQIYGLEKLHEAVLQRPNGKSLITVSNHVASMDDPLVIAAMLPPSALLNARNLRWTLCASDRCFKNPVTSAFFKCVKVLPVSRGEGIYQMGMDIALSKLNNGGWVHIFPEGSRSRDGGTTMGSAKRGVGRLVVDADNTPIVFPFVHTGMQNIMPIGANFPRIGQKVTILIGEPIQFDDLLLKQQMPRDLMYDEVTHRIGHKLHELKVQVDKLALEDSFLAQNNSPSETERANMIMHQIDWDGFGMGISADKEGILQLKRPVISQPNLPNDKAPWPPTSSNWNVSVGFSQGGGIVSRIRGCISPSEFMGFAASALFVNGENWMKRENWRKRDTGVRRMGPLKVWKRFLEENILPQANA